MEIYYIYIYKADLVLSSVILGGTVYLSKQKQMCSDKDKTYITQSHIEDKQILTLEWLILVMHNMWHYLTPSLITLDLGTRHCVTEHAISLLTIQSSIENNIIVMNTLLLHW